jgi:hypothetical protein
MLLGMSTQHPAIEAFNSLRKQTDDVPRLHFALLQQLWFDARGDARQRPSDYSLMVLRAMTAAFLASEGRSEFEVRATLINVMEAFEREYVRLITAVDEVQGPDAMRDAESPSKSRYRQAPMRRTKWPGTGNVVSFPKK